MTNNGNPMPNSFCPESYGQVGTGSDGALINTCIFLAQQGQTGVVWLSQRYALEQPIFVPPGPPVTFVFTGSLLNRNVAPPVFSGACIVPGPLFPANTPLVIVGSAGNVATNPHGTLFLNPRLSGVINSGSQAGNLLTGCTGIQINDTIDVHLIEPGIANFDRTGATGTAVALTSSGSQTTVGFQIYGGIISTCFRGIYGDGTGFTDYRLIGTLYHSNTQGITVGPTAGGGGGQITSNHLVYAAAPSGTYQYQNGSSAGDYTICDNYFDKNGISAAAVLGNAKGIFSNNHFLADANCTGPLVTLSTASQEMCFRGNQCNGNGSSMTALFKLLAGTGGAPTAGVYDGNMVYGTAASLIAPFIDKNNTAVPATNTATTYVAGNVFGA